MLDLSSDNNSLAWYSKGMNNGYFQSQEFKRSSRNAADTGIKLFFRVMIDLGMGIIHFIQGMVKMILGGK